MYSWQLYTTLHSTVYLPLREFIFQLFYDVVQKFTMVIESEIRVLNAVMQMQIQPCFKNHALKLGVQVCSKPS